MIRLYPTNPRPRCYAEKQHPNRLVLRFPSFEFLHCSPPSTGLILVSCFYSILTHNFFKPKATATATTKAIPA